MTQVTVDKRVKEELDDIFRKFDDSLQELEEIQAEMDNQLYELQMRIENIRLHRAE